MRNSCDSFKNGFCRICGKGDIKNAVCFKFSEPKGLKSVIDLNKKIIPRKIPIRKPKPAPTHKELIYKRDGYKCLACGKKKVLTIDHIIPLSLGGKNEIDNYQTLCRKCNMAKGNRIRDYRFLVV
jgi:5-methylcytosine-specific restriction endonuclease McrA